MSRYLSPSPGLNSNVSSPKIVQEPPQKNPFIASAGSPGSPTETDFVLDCLKNVRNFTGTVGTDVPPYNNGLESFELDPANPLHSFGSPNYPDDFSETIAGDADDDDHSASETDPAVLQAAAILISMRYGKDVPSLTLDDSSSPNQTSASGRKRVADLQPELLRTSLRNISKRQKVIHVAPGEHSDCTKDEDNAIDEADSDSESVQQTSIAQPDMKRSERILDVTNAEHAKLIAAAPKVGNNYYDSDADDLPGPIKGISKSHLFRNVAWGAGAKDKSNDADFPSCPSFRQFVPGRFERLADGTAADQKAKLVIKLTDTDGKKHIYANPPPRDWNNQEAITALNKRTVQQIRRTTEVKFRARVPEYIDAERKWLVANLTAGKPTNGWKRLVADFNNHFAGEAVPGTPDPRPARTQSSLSKEVGRFGTEFYGKGLVPVLAKKVKKEHKK